MNIAISAVPVRLKDIRAMRDAYRAELDCQIVHDSHHERGLVRSHAISVDGVVVGYGSVNDSATIREFYVVPESRAHAPALFRALLDHTHSTAIEAQTNDSLLFPRFEECATNVTTEAILFADSIATSLTAPDATFRKLRWYQRRSVFQHTLEPVGDWAIVRDKRVVATGGLLFHYNRPYGDIYMEVVEDNRRRGYGSFLVQELKRVARAGGHVPAARCDADNTASQATLQRAGMRPCGRIVRGELP